MEAKAREWDNPCSLHKRLNLASKAKELAREIDCDTTPATLNWIMEFWTEAHNAGMEENKGRSVYLRQGIAIGKREGMEEAAKVQVRWPDGQQSDDWQLGFSSGLKCKAAAIREKTKAESER